MRVSCIIFFFFCSNYGCDESYLYRFPLSAVNVAVILLVLLGMSVMPCMVPAPARSMSWEPNVQHVNPTASIWTPITQRAARSVSVSAMARSVLHQKAFWREKSLQRGRVLQIIFWFTGMLIIILKPKRVESSREFYLCLSCDKLFKYCD